LILINRLTAQVLISLHFLRHLHSRLSKAKANVMGVKYQTLIKDLMRLSLRAKK